MCFWAHFKSYFVSLDDDNIDFPKVTLYNLAEQISGWNSGTDIKGC